MLTHFPFRIFFFCLVSLAYLSVTSCSQPSSVGDLNLDVWREDRGGCLRQRLAQANHFKAIESQILGKSSNEIGRLFGAPDIHQLGKRNIKIYIYYLENGPHCEDKRAASDAQKAVFRFNAVSLLTEVSIQRTMPE